MCTCTYSKVNIKLNFFFLQTDTNNIQNNDLDPKFNVNVGRLVQCLHQR